MNAPLRNADRDLHDAADGQLRAQAIEALVDRLLEGKTVRTLTSRDIFDCAVDDARAPGYSRALDILEAAAALNGKAGDEFSLAANDVAAKAKAMVEGFVLGKADWIEEEAAEIEASAREDA